eukprot:768678-Hanusia_phi.AAC.5
MQQGRGPTSLYQIRRRVVACSNMARLSMQYRNEGRKIHSCPNPLWEVKFQLVCRTIHLNKRTTL